jgi:hypothetical protein
MTMTHNVAAFLPSVTRTLDGVDYTLALAETPDAGIAYLIQYGFSQAMADTQALGVAALAKAGVDVKALTEAQATEIGDTKATLVKASPETQAAYNAFVGPFLADRAKTRLEAIASGKMVFGSSERLSPEEKDRRDLVDTALRDAAKVQGFKLPTKAEELEPLRDYVYNARKAEIDAEVARRAKARAKAAPAIDLAALLARA